MDIHTRLRLKKQLKEIPVEFLILQASCTIENIIEDYINNQGIEFGVHSKLVEDSYNNIYKFNTKLKSHCEKNINKKFITGINETIILSQLTKASEDDNIGFNLDFEIEKNDFITFVGIKQLIDYIKKQEVNKELKNRVKILNMYVWQFLNFFKKELGV